MRAILLYVAHFPEYYKYFGKFLKKFAKEFKI